MGFGSPSLKGKALQWLAQREHSRAELQAKLLRHARNVQRKAAAGQPEASGFARSGSGSGSGRNNGNDNAGRSVDDAAASAEAIANAAAEAAEAFEASAAVLALEQARISQVLDDLAAAGLQSDTRTAQSLSRTKGSRCGVHRLKQHLQAKGLSPELVAQTVGEARSSEFERALELWRRRYGEPALDRAERLRQVRFLTSRGFDSDVVRRVVRGTAEDD